MKDKQQLLQANTIGPNKQKLIREVPAIRYLLLLGSNHLGVKFIEIFGTVTLLVFLSRNGEIEPRALINVCVYWKGGEKGVRSRSLGSLNISGKAGLRNSTGKEEGEGKSGSVSTAANL